MGAELKLKRNSENDLTKEWINKEDDVNWNDKMNSLVLIFPGNDEDNDPEGEENIDHNNVHEDDAADRKEAEENAEEGGEDDDAKEKEDENFKLALSLIAEREGVDVHN